jgi:hypothetical protein
MAKKIKLLRYRNVKLVRREKDEVLTIGEDIVEGHAETLVRIGGAEWVKEPARKSKAKK